MNTKQLFSFIFTVSVLVISSNISGGNCLSEENRLTHQERYARNLEIYQIKNLEKPEEPIKIIFPNHQERNPIHHMFIDIALIEDKEETKLNNFLKEEFTTKQLGSYNSYSLTLALWRKKYQNAKTLIECGAQLPIKTLPANDFFFIANCCLKLFIQLYESIINEDQEKFYQLIENPNSLAANKLIIFNKTLIEHAFTIKDPMLKCEFVKALHQKKAPVTISIKNLVELCLKSPTTDRTKQSLVSEFELPSFVNTDDLPVERNPLLPRR